LNSICSKNIKTSTVRQQTVPVCFNSTPVVFNYADKQFVVQFVIILRDTLMMVASTTETCWWLSICNKINFTEAHSLVY